MRPTAFPLFFALSLGLPLIASAGCKAGGASVDPTASATLPDAVEDFDAFVAGMNLLVQLDDKDRRYAALRQRLNEWMVPYVLERLDAGSVDEAERALRVSMGMYRAHELHEPEANPELAKAARRVYEASAASGREIPAAFSLGVLHQFGDADGRAWAERQFDELQAWVADAARYAEEPGAYLDLETVLEEATAEFPSPWLHQELEKVLLERYRAAHLAQFGAPAPLKELLADLDGLNATFSEWMGTAPSE